MPVNKFKSTAKSYTSSNKFLEDYEKLLKKNTGSSLLFAQDTGFNPAYSLTNQPVVAPLSAEGGLSVPQMSTNYQAPRAARTYAAMPDAVEPQGDVLGAQNEAQPGSYGDFFNQLDQIYQPEITDPYAAGDNGGAYGIQSLPDGGVLYSNGLVMYEDGSVREYNDPNAIAVRSNADGSIGYSDGTSRRMATEQEIYQMTPQPVASLDGNRVLYSDGQVRYGNYLYGQGTQDLRGVSGLSQAIFGQDQTVTQPYGNVNPIEPTPGNINYGTDFRTRDLQSREIRLPFDVKVLARLEDDGTRFGDYSGHMGYGNSLLVELPNGQRLRLSHLSAMQNVQPGDTIKAHDVLGIPGATGNTYGEHLDVEYRDADNSILDPATFSMAAAQMAVPLPGQGTPGQVDQGYQLNDIYKQQSTPAQPQQQPMMDRIAEPIKQAATPIAQAAQSVMQPAKQVVQKTGQVLGAGIEQANPTGTFDVGISEQLQGNQALANQKLAGTVENTGRTLGIEEQGVSEAALQGGLLGASRQLAGNLIDTASTQFKKYGLPDTGFSEWVANGKTVNTDVNLAPQSYAYAANGTPIASKAPEYGKVLGQNLSNVATEAKKSAGNLLSSAAKSIDDYQDKVMAKAGEGVSALKSGAQEIAQNIFKKPQASDIGAKRLIGEDGMQGENQAPSSLLDMNKVGQEGDYRDAFFKYGGADAFKSYLKDGIDKTYKGALDFNLFKDTVFDSADTVGNIFGSSYLGKEATDKYRSREAAKYPLMGYNLMGYEDGYDRGDIDRYNDEVRKQTDTYNNAIKSYLGSIPSVLTGTNWQMGTPKSARNVFADTALEMKTPESQINKSLMSMEPMSKAPNAFAANIVKPNAKPQINTNLMSVNRPQLSSVNVSKPSMQMSRPSAPSSSAPQINRNLMSMAAPAPKPNPTPQINKNLMSVAPKPAAKPAPKPAAPQSKAQPYAIATMKNGGVKYSDGSIRYSSRR